MSQLYAGTKLQTRAFPGRLNDNREGYGAAAVRGQGSRRQPRYRDARCAMSNLFVCIANLRQKPLGTTRNLSALRGHRGDRGADADRFAT